MRFLDTIQDLVKGAAVGVAALTALPVFGAIGTISATGIAVGSIIGAGAALADRLAEDDD